MLAYFGQVVVHYLKGWFFVDLLSILPFDIVSVALDGAMDPRLKATRTIRLLRLLKLARILKASRSFNRWRNRVSLASWVQSIVGFVILVIFLVHWVACFWVIVHDMQVRRRLLPSAHRPCSRPTEQHPIHGLPQLTVRDIVVVTPCNTAPPPPFTPPLPVRRLPGSGESEQPAADDVADAVP